MLKSYKTSSLFKRLFFIVVILNSAIALAQDQNLVNVILDGKPAVLNTKTGITKFVDNNSVNNQEVVNGETDLITTHIVEQGDTLYAISNKYGVSISHIKAINNLSTNLISINQRLKIGYANSAKVKVSNVWIVKKGDTLYSISKKTGVPISKIQSLNNINDNIIIVGKTLFLR